MAQKKALITGITGQDAYYLSELLLGKGYCVFGMVRKGSPEELKKAGELDGRIEMIEGELADQSSLDKVIKDALPDEVYNFGAQSFIPASWEKPVDTGEITALGPVRMLDAIRNFSPKARFYQASSSEMFGKVSSAPQSEETPFNPRSPYGIAKTYAYYMTVTYRERYGLFACSGILFNHESPRRGLEFVTRKITDAAARIKLGLAGELKLGSLDARRDWGFAGDYVKAMWLMLQQDEPDDFVVATGEPHSVEEFVEAAFSHLGLDWKEYVVTDERYVRPPEAVELVGDPTKAREKLGWKPETNFKELVAMLVDSDIERLSEK